MRGFSTIEVLIALMFLSTMVIASSLLVLGAPIVLESAREHHEARALALSALMQEERRLPGRFAAITAYATTSERYTVGLRSSLLPDETTKRVSVQVSWRGRGGREMDVAFTTYLTDYLHPNDYACDILPRGDWNRLQASERRMSPGDLLPSNWAPGVVALNDSAATRGFLALSSESTASGNAPSFFLYTVEGSGLAYRSSLPTSSTTAAVSDIALTRDYAYLASASTCATASRCGQLKIVDLDVPRIQSQLLLSRTSPPYAGSISTPTAAKSIAYHDGYVYLGLEQTPTTLGQEFNIIDVRNPDAPAWIGGYRIGRTVNDILVSDGRAYLATNARASADVLVLDVTDPAAIREIGRVMLPPLQTTSTFGYAHTLALYEDELHIGRSYVSNADEWMIADAALTLRASRNRGTALNPASVRGLILRESWVAAILSGSVEIWNRRAPFAPAPLGTYDVAGDVTGGVCIGNALYIASNDSGVGVLTRLTPL